MSTREVCTGIELARILRIEVKVEKCDIFFSQNRPKVITQKCVSSYNLYLPAS